jgi:hypothetical protein
LLILVAELLEGSVPGGIVGGVGGPALPDDVEPGFAEDPYAVWVVEAAGAAVEVGGPGVGVAAVAGEVADGVAQLACSASARGWT